MRLGTRRGLVLSIWSAAAIGLATGTQAADLPVYKAAPKAAAAIYNWTGFYLGGNVGYGIARNPSQHSSPALFSDETFTLAPAGAIGGVQIGFNWQATPHLVLGIEVDWQAGNQKDSQTCISICGPGDYARISQELGSFATLRGRLGWANGPVLYYVTGGWATGRLDTDVARNSGNFGHVQASLGERRSAWTIGGGIEAALAGNWTAKIEYLYLDFGTTAFSFSYFGQPVSVLSDIHNHVARLGVNYKFGAPVAAAAPVYPVQRAAAWAGFYVGGNVGYGVARTRSREDFFINGVYSNTETFDLGARGVLGGAQVGYNWQASNWVFGIEADLQASAQDSGTICVQTCYSPGLRYSQYAQTFPWFGTVRARGGFSSGAALFYVTGGLAYGRVETDAALQIGVTTFPSHSFTHTETGWTVGGGIEAALAGNWSAKAEYLFVDFGKVTDTFSSNGGVVDVVLTNDIRNHVFRLGLNYKLGGPVVAKN
jgi:outer membrane immunogenic protein